MKSELIIRINIITITSWLVEDVTMCGNKCAGEISCYVEQFGVVNKRSRAMKMKEKPSLWIWTGVASPIVSSPSSERGQRIQFEQRSEWWSRWAIRRCRENHISTFESEWESGECVCRVLKRKQEQPNRSEKGREREKEKKVVWMKETMARKAAKWRSNRRPAFCMFNIAIAWTTRAAAPIERKTRESQPKCTLRTTGGAEIRIWSKKATVCLN